MRRLSLSKTSIVLCLGLVAAALGVVAFNPADRTVIARPANPPAVAGPEYVPADAALFIHLDAAKLWGGSIGKAVRTADAKTFEALTVRAKSLFGVTPDELQSITAFWPTIKRPRDGEAFGVVLAFNAAYDKEKLKAGLGTLLTKGKHTLLTPSDRVAVLLIGLDGKYAKPRPAKETGPLTQALQEAASGKHLLVAGTATAGLPDEVRGNDVPPDIQPFLPLFRAESIVATVGLDKELAVEVRVKASTPAKAGEAEKALKLARGMLQDGLIQGMKRLDKEAQKDPAWKELFAVLTAAKTGLEGAKFTTNGDETRVRAAIPNDLPFGPTIATAVVKVREASLRAQSTNNLRQIAIAMHGYHDVNGVLPPAAVVDKTGKPLLSWRVLILPYVEQQALYNQFKLDEPWDSEHNKKLLDKMPTVYRLPGDTQAKPNETHYRAFVGNGAAFDYLKGHRFTDFADGTSNTILVATAAKAVPWSQPDELEFDPDKDMVKLLGFDTGTGANVAFADGHVSFISKSIDKKGLHALITRSGGEVVGSDE